MYSTPKSPNIPSNQKFGSLFTTIFVVGFFYFNLEPSKWLSIGSALLAALLALITIFVPSSLSPLNKAWFALGAFLGKVVSPIVLSIIFFVMIVPVALITRLFGRDVLLLKKRHVFSYWVVREPIDADSFKNQF
jgi:hypothetical protein